MTSPHRPYSPDDSRRLMIALFLFGIGMILWHFVYEYPRQQAAHVQVLAQKEKEKALEKTLEAKQRRDDALAHKVLQKAPRLEISAPEMEGSLTLQGARFNLLKLKNYRQEAKKDSPAVELLHPAGSPEAYFVEFGWVAAKGDVVLPTAKTLWKIKGDSTTLTRDTPVALYWKNGEGLRFELHLALTDDYLFTVTQRVINTGKSAVELLPYGYINRTLPKNLADNMILHEGVLGVLDEALTETTYKELIEESKATHRHAKGWLGITDKYWLTALVPPTGSHFTGNFSSYAVAEGGHRFQADFLAEPQRIEAGSTASYATRLFAGAKKLRMLDSYTKKYDIPLFDRAVDLGFLYFITKPLFYVLHWLYVMAGDFGLAILLLTVMVKLAMYPLANKSYIAMNEMKRLQPKIQQLKERLGTDKVAFNQEMMKLYKHEKINPASGCLPMFIQMPVFFALYKVLYVTIEMRHANFFGLIRDLSAPDPTNIFNAFGLVPWNVPEMLHLGILPILFACSMAVQQRMNPKPTDKAQAQVMVWLPWIFMVIMAGFPAGLLTYWIWSNMLSMLQQWSIKARYKRREKKRDVVSAA